MWFHILFLPAKLIKRILLFPLFLFILSGCYNNSHIRTLKVLEEGELVVSFNSSINFASEENLRDVDGEVRGQGGNVPIGLTGLRSEFSLLKGYKNSEAGFYGGYGFSDWGSGWHLGLEHKKYIKLKNLRRVKAGINIELTEMKPFGKIIHSIQSIKTTTSKENPFYGGFHSIYTYGSRGGHVTWYNSFKNIYYKFLIKGVGITLGREIFFNLFGMNTSTILQVDASVLRQEFLNINGGSIKAGDEYGKLGTISASLGFNFFNTRLKKKNQLTPLPKPRKDPVLKFDPETGIPIKKTSSGEEFDPETGEPVFDKSRNKNIRY